MAETISSGLKRKSITTCSRWASACRFLGKPIPGPWTFKYHPWLRDMHDSTAEMNVGQKSAQMGFSETALNIVFYNIDIKATDCLYVLPSQTPDASNFSASRFDPALELSPHLMNLFSDVKNIGHKRAGSANLYVRGSRSRSGLKSIPVGIIILDEVDEMDQANIPLATQRTAGQMESQLWAISTPTSPNAGINKMFKDSTEEHFFFKCPSCSKLTELLFPDCLEVTGEKLDDPNLKNSFIKCKECKNKLHHETKHEWLQSGVWVPGHSDKDARGFYINQLYSSTQSGIPVNFAKSYIKAQYDPAEEQELYNSKLGTPHVVSNAQINDGDINNCIGGHRSKNIPKNGILTLGVDVGKYFHYVINQWVMGKNIGNDINTDAIPKVVDFGKVLNPDELDKIMRDWGINSCVIDANPERRTALQFANRWYGKVKTCFYSQGLNGKEIHINKEEEHTISVDRTAWLDLSLGRFKKQMILLPSDTDFEMREQLKALIRIYKKDKNGNSVGRYDNCNNDDHYAHALNYAEIALQMVFTTGVVKNIKSPV